MVIGASAGGVSALLELVKTLPADFPAPIFIVQHIAADSPSIQPQLLSSVSALKARHPQNGETPSFLEPGRCRLLRAVSGLVYRFGEHAVETQICVSTACTLTPKLLWEVLG